MEYFTLLLTSLALQREKQVNSSCFLCGVELCINVFMTFVYKLSSIILLNENFLLLLFSLYRASIPRS